MLCKPAFLGLGDLIFANVGSDTVCRRLEVTIQSAGNAPVSFTPTVLVSDKNCERCWVGQLGIKGIFDGDHYFVMEDTADGTTLFRHGERFKGMLSNVLLPLIGEGTEKGLNAMNKALKLRV